MKILAVQVDVLNVTLERLAENASVEGAACVFLVDRFITEKERKEKEERKRGGKGEKERERERENSIVQLVRFMMANEDGWVR